MSTTTKAGSLNFEICAGILNFHPKDRFLVLTSVREWCRAFIERAKWRYHAFKQAYNFMY